MGSETVRPVCVCSCACVGVHGHRYATRNSSAEFHAIELRLLTLRVMQPRRCEDGNGSDWPWIQRPQE